MRFMFLIVVLFTFRISDAQKKPTKIDRTMLADSEQWHDGKIVLVDGTVLENGLVKYKDNDGILAFHDGEESRAFTPRAVSAFQFFDQKEQRLRQFLTLEAPDPENDLKKPLFFEVLKEYDNFAVLSRVGLLHAHIRRPTYDVPQSMFFNENEFNSSRLEMSQVETVFIIDSDGELRPYMEIVNTENMGIDFFGKRQKSKSRKLDKDLLEQYVTEPVFDRLKEFARQANLSFRKKSDLLKILAYYDQIR